MGFKKIYYKLEITAESPLSVGSGLNQNTDKDVIVDSLGCPFIPATAIAGVFRSTITDENIADKIFGYIPTKKEDKRTEENSTIRFYDAKYSGEKKEFFITNRDCVKLENKVGVDGAKFDMEAVETGAKFTSYIEFLNTVDGVDAESEIQKAIALLNEGAIGFGAKTSRGYGRVSVAVFRKEFEDIDEWLDFDMFECNEWGESVSVNTQMNDIFKLSIGLKLVGGISIREYTTEVSTENDTAPDYKHIALHDKNNTPVIPGTSWSGAFLDRYAELTGKSKNDKDIKSLFGSVDDKTSIKSRIAFSESQLSNGVWKKTTRNSIDRFTGGTKSGALYTELTYYNGETSLDILIKNNPSDNEKKDNEKKVLCACLADLHYGYLAIGGLTSVGRGLFKIESVNGKKIEGEIYDYLIKEVCAE